MKYRWTTAPAQPALCQLLSDQLALSPLLAQCLLNRGLSEPDPIANFLDPRLKNLADPFALPAMPEAVDRLWRARDQDEPLVIFGDYDVDGVTATALLYQVLTGLGWKVHYYLPHRMEEGYGLSQAAVQQCLTQFPVRLLLAVDCGSNATTLIQSLQADGIDVIVLDHHEVGDPLPPAHALVNPKLAAPAHSSFTELCSAGLAFKLAHALVKRGRQEDRPAALDWDIRPALDLVALGTIADLVPLTGENRILVSAGLERLNQTQRPGLRALREVAGITGSIGGYEVGFQLAPRLNAAGRLEDALESLHLLLAPDEATARPIALRLDEHNRSRQKIERDIVQSVLESLRARFDPVRDYVIVEGAADWHVGVVGIVASRVLKEFYRPTFILGGDAEGWRGSGRSIEGFDLAAALRSCDDLLLKHGGHAMAAGLTLRPDRLDALRDRLNELARQRLHPEQLQPLLRLDAEITPSDMTLERIRELNRLQQTGMGNPPVHLWMRGVSHHRPLQRLGKEKQHVKLWVTDGHAWCEAVWWGAGQEALPVGRFDLAFTPRLNDFQGRTTVQLSVLDWRPSAP